MPVTPEQRVRLTALEEEMVKLANRRPHGLRARHELDHRVRVLAAQIYALGRLHGITDLLALPHEPETDGRV